MIVDNEIYRYLPSIVVSTIDKMAMLGTSNDFKMLFGQVKKRCPVHGFTGTSRCSCAACSGKTLETVGLLKDPVPTLFIQDEMHLVKESLGTFDAHYLKIYKASETVKTSTMMDLKLRMIENPDDEYAGCMVLTDKQTILAVLCFIGGLLLLLRMIRKWEDSAKNN